MNILFLLLILIASTAHGREIVLEIPDEDIKIVETDVMNAEQWIRDAWAGKLRKSKERIIRKEIEASVNAGESIPAGEAEIIEKAFDRKSYQSREEREILK